MSSINLTYLRAFHAVAQEGSVSRAAHALGVSQPTISLQVRALEDTYGVKLLQKLGRGIELTRFGRDLLNVTNGLFTYVDAADDLLSGGRDLTSGHLLLGATSAHQAVDLLSAFGDRYPALTMSLTIREGEGLIAALREQRIDMVIHPSPPHGDEFTSTPLRVDPVVICVPADHPWADLPTITLRQLIEEQLILREQGTWTRTVLDDAFSASRLQAERIMESNDREAVHELIVSGLGVGVMSLTDSGKDQRIVRIPLIKPALTITEHLVFLSARRRLKIISAFLELVEELGSV